MAFVPPSNQISTLTLTNNAASQPSLVDLYNAQADSLYSNPSIYDPANYNSNLTGVRQPYVWVSPGDSDLDKYLTKYDTNVAPIGSTIRDEQRIGQFLASNKGIFFLAQQALMQGQNPFNETSLYDPLSIPLTIAAQASLGLAPAATRFVPIDAWTTTPPGTLGAALPSQNLDEGAGLQRARTANAVLNNFTSKYTGQMNVVGLLATAVDNFVPNLMPLPIQVGTYKLGDTFAYTTMLGSLTNSTSLFAYYNTNGALVNPKQPYSPPSSTESTYTDAVDNTTDGSLLENVWSTWEANGGNSGTQQAPNLASSLPSVTSINSTLKNVIGSFSNGGSTIGVSTVASLAPLATSIPGASGIPGVNSIGGVISGIQGIGSGQGPIGVKTYAQLMSTAASSAPGLSGPAAGYLSQLTSLIPSQTLTKGKGFPDAKNGTDTYNAQTLSTNSSLKGNSDAAYPNAANDLIPFYFSDLVNGIFIPFRATLSGIEQGNSAKWTDVHYTGRADRIFVYEGFDRDLSFSFKVYANSPEEMAPMWQRINYLVSLTSPSNYTSGPNGSGQFIVPPFVKITIGDLIKNQPVVLQSIGVTVPEEASWELLASAAQYNYLAGIITRSATVGQVPMYVEISISAAILEKKRAQAGNLQFGDTSGGPWSNSIGFGGGASSSSPLGSTDLPGLSSVSSELSNGLSTLSNGVSKISSDISSIPNLIGNSIPGAGNIPSLPSVTTSIPGLGLS